MKKIKYLSIAVLLSFCATVFAATNQPPVVMLKKTADQMLVALKSTAGSTSAVKKVVRRLLLPKVDVTSMSRATVGRQYWSKASNAQRNEFKKQFTEMIITTYATPLANYKDETIQFYPIRNYSESAKRVQVYSKILRANGPAIPVSYRLVKRGNTWRVYDFSVEGVSMIQSYRSQFADTLRQSGFDGLLKQLRQHNRGKR